MFIRRGVKWLSIGIGGACLAAWSLGTGGSAMSSARASEPGDRGVRTERPSILLAQKTTKKKRSTSKKEASPAPVEDASTLTKPAGSSDTGPKFSKDIAPILVRNCTDCHNPQRRRGKLDLSTFEKIMAGSDKEKIIAPGKPDESHLVLRIKGEETPKMPEGNDRNLAQEAIDKIESWVKAGARLDAGIDPKATLESYAPTPEQLRTAELKKLPADQRDKMVEAIGLKRWKQASPKTTPEVTSSAHFLIFSTLPKDRAATVSKKIESAYTQLRATLSEPGVPALDWAEKTSLFLFSTPSSYVEFVRSLENREVEAGESGTASFKEKEPYIAVVDPRGGRDDSAPSSTPAAHKPSRSKRGSSGGGNGTPRSVEGMLAEQLVVGVLNGDKQGARAGLAGAGAGSVVRGGVRSSQRLPAAHALDGGRSLRAGMDPPGQRRARRPASPRRDPAVGLAIVEWLTNDREMRPLFPAFVQGLIEGGPAKLDEVLQNVYRGLRENFLATSGEWVATHYGAGN